MAMPTTIEASTQEYLPLLDERAMDDWCSDIDKDDVLAILARVPDECHSNVAEIERAIATGSLAACKRAAHRLKGMAGNLGAFRLAKMARDIELKSESIEDVAGQMPGLQETLTVTLAALQGVAHSR
ncbi:MAG: Hpt domain-containing protein [Rhodospirillales bacterium]|nr:Hpt domain-containing protein [Rhodospirillales bacterium]